MSDLAFINAKDIKTCIYGFCYLTYYYVDDCHYLVDEACPGTLVLEYPQPQAQGGEGQDRAEEHRYSQGQIVTGSHG